MKRSRDASEAPHPTTSVRELVRAHELAALSLLDCALHVACDALHAVHPTLDDELRCPAEDGRVVGAARSVVAHVTRLRDALGDYRRALRDALGQRERAPHDDLPF